MKLKSLIAAVFGLVLLGLVGLSLYLFYVSSNLPKLVTLTDYKPLLASEVYDANGEKIGEFFREKRQVVPYDAVPQNVVKAFVAAEDDKFFEHGGINYTAIIRAFFANIKAGHKVQGGSTITQQVARSLMLSSEKTYDRKIREIFLSYKMESNLSKRDILYLYLNQIYLGEGAYGVATAAQVYFHKDLKDLRLEETAVLAGMPQAPTRYSPIDNPTAAKARQRYVLNRMLTVNFITKKEHDAAVNAPIVIYPRQKLKEIAPYFIETVRQFLVRSLGEKKVLDEGLKIYTGLIKKNQLAAQQDVMEGLRALDKRQGYRGPVKNISDIKQVAEYLLETRDQLMDDATKQIVILPDGSVATREPLDLNRKEFVDADGKKHALPDYISPNQIVDGIVTKIDDHWGLVTVRFGENQGVIDLETMRWARRPNFEVRSDYAPIARPSEALKMGDVILVRVVGEKFVSKRLIDRLTDLKKQFARAHRGKKFEMPKEFPQTEGLVALELEQEPIVEGALLSFDLNTQDIIAMVGGYSFERNEFNRALQAVRQTGSSFKPVVYTAALDNGFNPASVIVDAPIVYEQQLPPDEAQAHGSDTKVWKPGNYEKRFGGDVLFRNALVRSLNIPTVKILDEVSVPIAADYGRRLGIFSPLNMDLSLGLGSSSVTLYEMTKVYSNLARLGRRTTPILIKKVVDQAGQTLVENLSLDQRFENEMKSFETTFEEKRMQVLQLPNGTPAPANSPQAALAQQPSPNPPPLRKEAHIYFSDKDQLVSSQTAYLMTSLLKGVISDPGGTGGAAREIGRPAAAKTGTTSSYFDAWFMGYTPQIVTGVWTGFDTEKTLGSGETGARSALPIWLSYMKTAHENLPRLDFQVPDKIVFANIDNETGQLASANSKTVVRQAFLEGTEPKSSSNEQNSGPGEDKDFYREDLSE